MGLDLWVIWAIALEAVTFLTNTGTCDWLPFSRGKCFVLHLVSWICLWLFLKGHIFFAITRMLRSVVSSVWDCHFALWKRTEQGGTLWISFTLCDKWAECCKHSSHCATKSSMPHLHKEYYPTSRASAWPWLNYQNLQLWLIFTVWTYIETT